MKTRILSIYHGLSPGEQQKLLDELLETLMIMLTERKAASQRAAAAPTCESPPSRFLSN